MQKLVEFLEKSLYCHLLRNDKNHCMDFESEAWMLENYDDRIKLVISSPCRYLSDGKYVIKCQPDEVVDDVLHVDRMIERKYIHKCEFLFQVTGKQI